VLYCRGGGAVEFSVRFYETIDGEKPLVGFINDLRLQHPDLHKQLLAGIKALQKSERHKMPLTRLVDAEDRIFELRVGKTNIARAFFFYTGGQVVLLTHGYVKKSQKADEGEIRAARQAKHDWEGRHNDSAPRSVQRNRRISR